MTTLTTSVSTAGDESTVVATGEIDLSNAGEFARALAEATARARAVTVDLSGVTYLDSAGIRCLFTLSGVPLHVVVTADSVPAAVVRLTALEQIATVVETS